MDEAIDPRVAAIHGILRLAEEDRRRGIRFWFDPQLAGDLRDLVREAGTQAVTSRPSSARISRARPGSQPAARSRQPEPAAPPSWPDLPPAPETAAPPLEAPPDASAPDALPQAEPPRSGPTARPSAIWVSAPREGRSARAAAGGESAASKEPRPQWGPPPLASNRAVDWEEQLRAVEAEASACKACGLCRTRRTVVFGTGKARVPLVFVGEAPGADEDAQGIPFVGRAGQLLTRIIEAIGLKREDVYICNVLKCRPPENRNPAPDEIARCSPFLRRQLALLKPKVICTLGLFASQMLLETTAPIGKLRGRLLEHDGFQILPTYHPAALLRNPGLKAVVWEDVQLLRRILDQ